jgi:hypothetical protein
MSNKTDQELKSEGFNRAMRRIILGIDKRNPNQRLQHPIPSWRNAMHKKGA